MSRRPDQNKRTIGVRVTHDVIAALELAASQQNRTLSNMAAQALEDWCVARSLIKRDETLKIGPRRQE